MGGAMSDSIDNLPVLVPPPRLFSLKGRLGRMRYIAHCMVALVLVFMCIFGAGLAALAFYGPLTRTLYVALSVLLLYVILPVFFAMQTVRRVHDFNMGGWLALLLLVPIVNPLLFWFAPGTRGDNSYGPTPKDESSFVKLIATLIPLLLVVWFLFSAGAQQNAAQTDEPLPMKSPHNSLQPYTP